MECSVRRFLAVSGFAAFVCGSTPGFAQTAPPLGSAASFAVLGESVLIESGPIHISGNLGAGSGGITGASPIMRVGNIYRNDALVRQARIDAVVAYDDLAARTCTDLSIDGSPVSPGVYRLASPAELTGPVILDAAGNPDAIWIFRTAGALTMAAGSRVLVINGGRDANVFWQVGGAATIGAGSAFIGNLLALSSITLGRDSSVSGRLLARSGVVTLNRNDVSLCCEPIAVSPATLSEGAVGASYSQMIAATGGTESFTFAHTSGSLPPGLTLSPTGALMGRLTEAGSYRFTITATDSHACAGTREYTIAVSCGTTTIELSPLKAVPATAAIDYVIEASGGTPPYRYSVTSGDLPVGLELDRIKGVISGTPTKACSAQFTITATDANGCSGSRTFTICLISILPETLPNGFVGVEYSQMLSACGAKEFRAGETLPDGLELALGGKLFRKPTKAGTYVFTVTTSDDLLCAASRTYTVQIYDPITILPVTLPNGTVGMFYSETITASGGVGPPYVFEPLPSKASLPPELSLTKETKEGEFAGTLSGMPTTPGLYKFTVKATDGAGSVGMREYQLVICGNLALSPPILPDARACERYSQKLEPSGGVAPYSFAVKSGTLPEGLALDPATGEIAGIPKTPGKYKVLVTLTDALTRNGCPGREFSLPLLVICHVTISPPSLPDGVVGVGYSETLTACGGTPDYTFTVTSGSPPPGLMLSLGGVLAGMPTAAGSYTFTVTATDSAACLGDREYTINVLLVAPAGAVPTLSAWATLLFLCLLAAAGVVATRRA